MNIKPDARKLVDFMKTYLSIVRRYCSVLPVSRRVFFPDFWNNPYQTVATVCEDGVAIEFKRKIRRKRDTFRVTKRRMLNDVYPQLTGLNPRVPVKGLKGIVIKDLAISTKSCIPFLKSAGTLLTIPDDGGFLRATEGGDVRLQNVGFFYLDRKGKPRQMTFKGLWILAGDASILSNPEEAQKRALTDFLRQLLSVAPILGEKMKRYSEYDLLSEIETVAREYLTLVNSENVTEPEVQDFLEKHCFILSPLYLDLCPKTIVIKPQMNLKTIDRKVDFMLLKEPTLENYGIRCSAIEIKKPSDKLFTRKGELSDPLKVGLNQVDDIFEFIKSNPKEARKHLGVRDTSEIVGTVLIGRRRDLSKDEAKWLIDLNRRDTSRKILFFDDLLGNIKFISNALGRKFRQPVVVVGQKGDLSEDFTGSSGEIIQEALDYLSKRIEERNQNPEKHA